MDPRSRRRARSPERRFAATRPCVGCSRRRQPRFSVARYGPVELDAKCGQDADHDDHTTSRSGCPAPEEVHGGPPPTGGGGPIGNVGGIGGKGEKRGNWGETAAERVRWRVRRGKGGGGRTVDNALALSILNPRPPYSTLPLHPHVQFYSLSTRRSNGDALAFRQTGSNSSTRPR